MSRLSAKNILDESPRMAESSRRSFVNSPREQHYFPGTITPRTKGNDPNVVITVITSAFKEFDGSRDHELIEHVAAKSFIARMLLVIQTSSVNHPVFRKLLTPPQDDKKAEIPIDYNVL